MEVLHWQLGLVIKCQMVSLHSQVSRFPPDHLGHASSNTLGRAQVLLLLLEKVKVVMKSQYKNEKTMSKNFLPDLCLWSWGRQARQGRLSVAQLGATIIL